MSQLLIGSDWHLGQNSTPKMIRETQDPSVKQRFDVPWETKEQNYDFIGDNYFGTKRDALWLLGDIIFEPEALEFIQKLPAAKKILIPGNHDWQKFDVNMFDLAKTFTQVRGTTSFKRCWLSHFPIHESEFWRKDFNIHGHIHDEMKNEEIRDNPRYVNVNVDVLWPKEKKIMINFQQLLEKASKGEY